MTGHLLVAARPALPGLAQPTPDPALVLGVLATATPGQAVHDVRQTWALNHGQALDAITTAIRRHPGHPTAREWARLLRIARVRLTTPDPARYPTHAHPDPDHLDQQTDTAVEADYSSRGEHQ